MGCFGLCLSFNNNDAFLFLTIYHPTTTTNLARSCCRRRPQHHPTRRRRSQLDATSASAAYLDSLTYASSRNPQQLLGATSNYLQCLSDTMLSLEWNDNNHDTIGGSLQQPQPQQLWSAELFQQATDDLTNALMAMTLSSSSSSSIDDDDYSIFSSSSSTVFADAVKQQPQYLWEAADMVADSTTTTGGRPMMNPPSLSSMVDPQAALNELTQSLNDMLNQFTAETTKAASSAANSARNVAVNINLPKPSRTSFQFPKSNIPTTIDTISQQLSQTATSVSTQLSDSVQSALQSTRQQLQQAGQTSQASLAAAVDAATPAKSLGVAARHDGTVISATDFAATQGFSNDLSGVVELITATVVSAPRAMVDAAAHEYAPTAMDDAMQTLYHDLWQPLTAPIQSFASLDPLQQAQAVLKVLQLLLAVMVAVPRALIESMTGLTVTEFQTSVVAQLDIYSISQGVVQFSSVVVSAITVLLKLVLTVTSAIIGGVNAASGSGGAAAAAATSATILSTEDILSKSATFLSEDLLPVIVDGLLLIIQQIVNLLLQGGSMIVAGL